MILKVTAEDLAKGKHNDKSDCPIGLAIQRVNKPSLRYRSDGTIDVYVNGYYTVVPKEIADKLKKWELEEPTEPFEVYINGL